MSSRNGKLHALVARVLEIFHVQPRYKPPHDPIEFARACKELAYWSASDAGLGGPIEGFDGCVLSRAADGMFTLRMTLADSQQQRSPADAANIILRSLGGLRIIVLLEIDGRRFTYMAPDSNPGVRKLCEHFTNRTEHAG